MGLCQEFASDVEVRIENIKFLRHAFEKNQDLPRLATAFQEVTQMLQILRICMVSGDTWIRGQTQSAKLLAVLADRASGSQKQDLQMKAFECLLEIR